MAIELIKNIKNKLNNVFCEIKFEKKYWIWNEINNNKFIKEGTYLDDLCEDRKIIVKIILIFIKK